MPNYNNLMSKQEKLACELIGLYRAHGYRRYRMEKFESYDVYLRNRDYMDVENIVTFTDSKGKLLALRPDVTLSLINNLPEETGVFKFYYDENVFRRDSEGGYREIRQIGAEYIGGEGIYPCCEATLLAIDSLKAIGAECVLSIGNMDLVKSLLSSFRLDEDTFNKALSRISAKAFHELDALLGEENAKKIAALSSIEGEPFEAFEKVKKLLSESADQKAADDLYEILKTIDEAGLIDFVKLDLSIVENANYHNGIVFRGYVRGAAGTVLRGGCYDNILNKFGRKERAVGFSIYVSEIEEMLRSETVYDVLVISEGASAGQIARAVRKFALQGKRVMAVASDDPHLKAIRRVYAKETENA